MREVVVVVVWEGGWWGGGDRRGFYFPHGRWWCGWNRGEGEGRGGGCMLIFFLKNKQRKRTLSLIAMLKTVREWKLVWG